MPRLNTFKCYDRNAGGQPLPPELPVAAPGMLHLVLENCGLAGSLPESWGNWPSLEELDLSSNGITGTLPDSFAALGNLRRLALRSNRLHGTLPTAWGQAKVMPAGLRLEVADNEALHGSVPASWGYFFAGTFSLGGTNITGCPPPLEGTWGNTTTIRRCFDRPAAPLFALKGILEQAMAGRPGRPRGGLATWVDGVCLT